MSIDERLRVDLRVDFRRKNIEGYWLQKISVSESHHFEIDETASLHANFADPLVDTRRERMEHGVEWKTKLRRS